MISLIGRFACLIAFGIQLIATKEAQEFLDQRDLDELDRRAAYQEVVDELTRMHGKSLLMPHPIRVERGTLFEEEILSMMTMLKIPGGEEFVQAQYCGGEDYFSFIKSEDIPEKVLNTGFADCQTKNTGMHHNGQYIVTHVEYQGQDRFIITSKNNGNPCFVKNGKEFLDEYMPFTKENIQKAMNGAQIIYDTVKAQCPKAHERIVEEFDEFMQERQS